METTGVSRSMDKAISPRSLIDPPYNTGDYFITIHINSTAGKEDAVRRD
jgi:hypothetical protein